MKIEKWDDVHGNTTSDERMVAFLESSTDSYAVLQLKRIDETEQFCSVTSPLRKMMVRSMSMMTLRQS